MSRAPPPPPSSAPPAPPSFSSSSTTASAPPQFNSGLPPGIFARRPFPSQQPTSASLQTPTNTATPVRAPSPAMSAPASYPQLSLYDGQKDLPPPPPPPSVTGRPWQPPGPSTYGTPSQPHSQSAMSPPQLPSLTLPSFGKQPPLPNTFTLDMKPLSLGQTSFSSGVRQQNQPTTFDSKAPLRPQTQATVPTGETRLKVALDYGTTFTGVAYLTVSASTLKEMELEAFADNIKVIQDWPPREVKDKVPSQYSYSLTPKGCQQWGYDIDDNSLVLKETKIQLEHVGDRISELRVLGGLLEQLRLLDLSKEEVTKNGIPKHLGKEPEDIVKDYLDNIAEKAHAEIQEKIGRHVLSNIPMDLVVTHPAIWSDRALNSTYRAVRAAFNSERFPHLKNVSFVPEPVACAHYTLREAWRENHLRFRKNDCFIVVDAGGGTVDLASFKVLSVDHEMKQIKLEQVGDPLGDTCGSTRIDASFERFAEDRLGPDDWDKLKNEGVKQPTTGGHSIMRPRLRRMQDKFQPIKHAFDGQDNGLAVPIQLPRGIGTIDDQARGLMSGTLSMTVDDLREMFNDSVERTLYLVEQAITLIEVEEDLPVKQLFLSGGFAQSPYLHSKVQDFCKKHRIGVERGEDCWAAVAKGAIIKSLGVYTEKPLFVQDCPRHYGIKVRRPYASYENHLHSDVNIDSQGMEWALDQIRWFVQKGDALFPNKAIIVTHDCNFSMKASDYPVQRNKRNSSVSGPATPVWRDIVFVASDRDEAPTRLDATDKTHEQMVSLRCDLTKVPQTSVEEIGTGNKQAGKWLKFNVQVEIQVLDKVLVRVKSANTVLLSQEIRL
ncbi:putative heat shock protein family 70 protein [Podospora australis]|uniref:Heat shock protein family 70 protein n=1 Tax=Podospora australis TaxID=1536484 RepID=A0AAN6WTN1_9PEZI|nr:putative heat shock protein family 70 protein [Podospora australis]